MAEFTGERLVPGEVDLDLYHEHLARYEFTVQLPIGHLVLDAGCGVGYGVARLGSPDCISVGLDQDIATVQGALQEYGTSSTRFLAADVRSLPFHDQTFSCAVSFEVIEHLSEPQYLVQQLARVTRRDGIVVISTPNKMVYDFSRGDAGPNPFHVHEFTFSQFRDLLEEHFRHVRLYAQDHTPTISIRQGSQPHHLPPHLSCPSDPQPLDDNRWNQAQFFVAICSQSPLADTPDFLSAIVQGNVLLERQRHIQLLSSEIATKDTWLQQSQADHQTLLSAHQELERELDEKIRWAHATTAALDEKSQELATTVAHLHHTEALLAERTVWAQSLSADLQAKCDELARAVAQLHHTEEELSQRTKWAMDTIQQLETANASLAAQLDDKCDELKRAVDQLHHVEGQLETESNQYQITLEALRNEVATSAHYRAELERVALERNVLANSRIVKMAQRVGLLRPFYPPRVDP
ncbi:MAG: methyltransferase domain-containing protein [Bryobacterales bacterium]|jgi:SAM-dependent methyltransferase|nr:methyltransferase domain-containing protein [Bryobacterales bacterium]